MVYGRVRFLGRRSFRPPNESQVAGAGPWAARMGNRSCAHIDEQVGSMLNVFAGKKLVVSTIGNNVGPQCGRTV